MDKRTWCFVLAALLFSVALAAFVSPCASSAPDGLEKFAAEQQFAARAEGRNAWSRAPWADYKVSWVWDRLQACPTRRNGPVSTGLAGATGTLLVFVCGWGLSKALARRRMKPQTPTADERR